MRRHELPGGGFLIETAEAPAPSGTTATMFRRQGDMSSPAPKGQPAPKDGIQVFNGKRFRAVAGQEMYPGAVFQEAEKPAKTGPKATTKATGPSETS